jgi:MYXO-CTERM domain-containing protein
VAVVHPRVVLLAAHCLYSELESVAFGENAFDPAAAIPIAGCEAHPSFMVVDDMNMFDLGYCTLTEDAPAVPIVPPLMGCEADALAPGATVTLPGYGMNDELGESGHGTKRWTTNTVEAVDDLNNDLYLLGADGSSVCFGDSGGPAYLLLPDGTWRVAGITSEAHPSIESAPYCGYGAVYDLVHLEMEWFEQQTGYDLTPCFDADGTWNADDSCGAFPKSLTTAGLDWSTACATDDISGFSATCGDPWQAEGTGTGTGSDTESDTGDEPTSGTTSGDDDTTSTTAPASTGIDDTGSTSAPPLPQGGSDSTGPAQQDDNGGCGCRTDTPMTPVLAVLLLALRRRRRGTQSFSAT